MSKIDQIFIYRQFVKKLFLTRCYHTLKHNSILICIDHNKGLNKTSKKLLKTKRNNFKKINLKNSFLNNFLLILFNFY